MGLIPNDVILGLSLLSLFGFLLFEVFQKKFTHSKSSTLTKSIFVPKIAQSSPIPLPVHKGRPDLIPTILSIPNLARYLPLNSFVHHQRPQHKHKNKESDSIDSLISVEEPEQKQAQPDPLPNKQTLDVIGLPNIPGCEPDGPACRQMQSRFPGVPVPDLVRFLVARKGDVELASAMLTKALAWHRDTFPLSPSRREEVLNAIKTKCFFPHGTDRDGAPVLYFRGALYDSTKAPAEAFVRAAAMAIDWALKRSKHTSVTVFVHAVNVPGAANAPADINFIKGFIAVLSDNYPERLKMLAIYPFPWYGRAIWSVVKVFVDKRSQDKVLLLSSVSLSSCPSGFPKEIESAIDPNSIPRVCGGKDDTPIVDLSQYIDDIN